MLVVNEVLCDAILQKDADAFAPTVAIQQGMQTLWTWACAAP